MAFFASSLGNLLDTLRSKPCPVPVRCEQVGGFRRCNGQEGAGHDQLNDRHLQGMPRISSPSGALRPTAGLESSSGQEAATKLRKAREESEARASLKQLEAVGM